DTVGFGAACGATLWRDGRRVARSGPDGGECHAALGGELPRLADEHVADSATAVPFSHVELGDLALQPGPRVVQDDPAEADNLSHLVADRVDDVLTAERGGNLGQVTVD